MKFASIYGTLEFLYRSQWYAAGCCIDPFIAVRTSNLTIPILMFS